MANEDKLNIWVEIADVKPIGLNINPADEEVCRKAESLVNTLWQKWTIRFGESATPHEVLARVAFQFARLYADEYAKYADECAKNAATNSFLTDFEKKLDELVVKG